VKGNQPIFPVDRNARSYFHGDSDDSIATLESRLARLVASAPGVMFTYLRFGPQRGCLPYVSPAIQTLSGLSPGKLESDITPLIRLIHPDDRNLLDGAIERSVCDLAPVRVVVRLRHPDAGERWIEVRATPESIGGSYLWHGFLLDITESKRAGDLLKDNEPELRRTRNCLAALVDTMPDLVWLKDTNGVYLACNPAFERFFGAGEAAIIGKTDYDFVDRELADFFRQKDREAITAERICINEETVTYAIDGRSGILETRKVPVLGDDGEIFGILGIGRDVSALKQAEDRLRKSRDALRALTMHQNFEREKERRELAHQIHENLAQSLTALRMNLSLLEMNLDHASWPEQLKRMRDITDQCISRSRTMVSMLRPTALDIGIIPALRWLADNFSKGAGLRFELQFEENIDLDDETATFLFRAAQEALINTTLHAAATRVRLSLQVVDGNCHLLVRDNGRGFNPDSLSAETTFGLLGLTEQALHLSGALTINSAPGQGATLEIQVPAIPGSPRDTTANSRDNPANARIADGTA
jgi:PAS domain S-box-containing protein